MKKTLASLAVASLIVALGLVVVTPAHAQLYSNTSGSGSSMSTSGTSTTGGTGSMSSSTSGMTGTTTGSTTPGLPNTGAGGNAATNMSLLLGSGLIVVGGAVYLTRRFAL